MAFGIRSTSTGTGSSGTAMSASAPSGTITGDLVFVLCHGNDDAKTISDNNGGTPFSVIAQINNLTDGSSGSVCSAFYRRILGGDPSTYNFTLSGSDRWTVTCITFQEPNLSSIVDVTTTTFIDITSQTNGDSPSITTATANAYHIIGFFIDGVSNSAITTPAGYTVQQNNGFQDITLCTKLITSPGATGTQTFAWVAASHVMAISIAIPPPSASVKTGNYYYNLR